MSDEQQPMWGMAVIVEGDRWQFRPPIPRHVWDAMVQRLTATIYASGHNAWVSMDAAHAALRAALGNPEVEP